MCSLDIGSCSRSANMSKGCPIPVGDSVCGETNSLEIMKEFNRLYEERMTQVDSEAGGDCLQEKIKLQQEWIRNLTQQNEMLVRAVQELEYEATERVRLLEEKLHKSAQCLCEGEKIINDKERTVQELTQKLNYYNSFGDVEGMARELQSRRKECESLQQTTRVADRELESLQSKIRKLETENDSLKETLTQDKTHIEQLDEQFKCFLQERDELKRKNKVLEKKSKNVYKENETLHCKCEVLKTEIQQLKEKNENLQDQVETAQKQLENLKAESVACQEKMQQILEENRKTIEQVISLNEENRNLSQSIDVLRQRSEYTNSFTQEEVSKLNSTIGELRVNLERTRAAQEEEEKSHQKEISMLNETIGKLEHELQTVEEKHGIGVKSYQKEITLLNETIGNLEHELQSVEEKCGKGVKSYQKEIALLNETIAKLEHELQTVEEKYGKGVKSYQKEITLLNETIDKSEHELQTAEEKYGKAVKSYQKEIALLNETIGKLEHELQTVEEKYGKGVKSHQNETTLLNETISKLEHELQTIEGKYGKEVMSHLKEITLLNETVSSLEEDLQSIEGKYVKEAKTCKICKGRSKVGFLENSEVQADLESKESELIKMLNDVESKMAAEIEKRDNEIQLLKNKVNDLESSLKICEERAANLQDAEQLKKLSKQKRCYEEIITYFKREMSLMADQLNNLQELLTLSNDAAQQESGKIMQAFMEVQSINEKLSNQLCACEQKVQLENQMNQLHEAKICELQQLISEKEIDLSKHDQAVLNIRKTLNDSLKQNEALQETIMELNDTISNLQEAIKEYEYENCASKKSCQEFQEQIGGYCAKLEELKKHLDDKTAECLKLEMAYNNEKRALKAAQKQLQETDNLQHQHQQELVKCLEELKQKLAVCDENNTKLCKECESLQTQLANLSRKEAVKDLEIKRYRKIVGDLKSTMMELNTELNKNLAQKELKTTCKNANCLKNIDKDESKLQDICLGCPCEVEFYQKMVEILKKSVSELKRKLNDTQQKNKALEEQIKQKDAQLSELEASKEKLNQKMLESRAHDQKITELEREIDRLSQELQVKSLQLNDVKRSTNEINGSKCVQLACAQEEIASLKNEMATILNRQYVLKRENEELQSQTAQLHCTINCLNEKNKLFKEQIDQYILKVKNLSTEKEALLRKNKELLGELRSLQCMTYTTDKQQREISSLNRRSMPNKTSNSNRPAMYSNLCTSPCSLGSQGTASFYDGGSPPPSPDFGPNNEWYSANFRTESDNSEEEYCVNTLENLTQQMRMSNKIWMDEKRSRRDCRVTKDVKDKN